MTAREREITAGLSGKKSEAKMTEAEIAAAIAHLASDDTRFAHGAIFAADSGRTTA